MKILGINELFGVHDSGVDTLKKFIRRIKGMAYSYAINFIEKEKALNYKFYEMAKRNFNYSIIAFFILLIFILLRFLFVPLNDLLFIVFLTISSLFLLKILYKSQNSILFIVEKTLLIIFQIVFTTDLYLNMTFRNDKIRSFNVNDLYRI